MLKCNWKLLSLIPATLVIASCGGPQSVKETLGIAKNAPDEFSVMPSPPLSVPPEFALKPPAKPGSVENNNTVAPVNNPGIGRLENSLLQKAGASANSSGIRDMVDEEAAKESTKQKKSGGIGIKLGTAKEPSEQDKSAEPVDNINRQRGNR